MCVCVCVYVCVCVCVCVCVRERERESFNEESKFLNKVILLEFFPSALFLIGL